MQEFLNGAYHDRYNEFRCFAQELEKDELVKQTMCADQYQLLIELCAKRGYMGCMIPDQYGGNGWDVITFSCFIEAVARVSVSLAALFNVHTMVMHTILKWGSREQREKWLPQMTKGLVKGALALTEPEAGSDAAAISCSFQEIGDGYLVNGRKRWITFGADADIYLVFGKLSEKPMASIIERNNPGLTVTPIQNMLGFKTACLAALAFNDCYLPEENRIGRAGDAMSYIIPYALNFGRISVIYSALGMHRACMEICSEHVMKRRTFGKHLIRHGQIAEMITDMGVDYQAGCLLALNASERQQALDSDAIESVMTAKYFTSKAICRHTANAVQIMGAQGCLEDEMVAGIYRDAKILEIIEGSTQILQNLLGISIARKYRRQAKVEFPGSFK